MFSRNDHLGAFALRHPLKTFLEKHFRIYPSQNLELKTFRQIFSTNRRLEIHQKCLLLENNVLMSL